MFSIPANLPLAWKSLVEIRSAVVENSPFRIELDLQYFIVGYNCQLKTIVRNEMVMQNRVSIRARVTVRVSSASPFRKIPVADFPHYTPGPLATPQLFSTFY